MVDTIISKVVFLFFFKCFYKSYLFKKIACFWVLDLLCCMQAFDSCGERGPHSSLRCTGFMWLLLLGSTGLGVSSGFSSCVGADAYCPMATESSRPGIKPGVPALCRCLTLDPREVLPFYSYCHYEAVCRTICLHEVDLKLWNEGGGSLWWWCRSQGSRMLAWFGTLAFPFSLSLGLVFPLSNACVCWDNPYRPSRSDRTLWDAPNTSACFLSRTLHSSGAVTISESPDPVFQNQPSLYMGLQPISHQHDPVPGTKCMVSSEVDEWMNSIEWMSDTYDPWSLGQFGFCSV